ncbi:MAG: hypothetical protein P8P87_01270 [Crocinitomicaceae bacterium]|nr:hypothetical protein [Crocinitomicaceae bacterium]
MIESFISFFKRSASETQEETPEGICPNCWVEQEYDNVTRELYDDKQIDVNNHKARTCSNALRVELINTRSDLLSFNFC